MHDWKAYVRDRLPPLDIRPEREVEIVDELALQLEAAYDTAIARGATEDEARRRAASEVTDWPVLARTLTRIERRLGARVPATLRTADPVVVGAGRGGFMSGIVQDIRYALRALWRAPGFTTAAILTLALGMGATTIVYSLVDGILLRPLPIADPHRVVLARELSPRGVEGSLAWPNFVDWKARARSFENLAAWRGMPANLTGIDVPRRIMIRHVTWNLFDVLGVRPVVGRGLTAADDRPGVERVGLISHGFWQTQFGGDAAVIGRRIQLDDVPVTIVGVLPAEFTVARVEDAFLPLGSFLTPGNPLLGRGNHMGIAAIGRLAPGVTLDQARAELSLIARQLAESHPDTNSGLGATASPLLEVLVQQARPTLVVLVGAVAAMLLIACVNIANLLLVRGAGRAQELEVRRALGAERWTIVRQLLTESVVLALAGGVAGIALAYAGFEAFVALLPADQPRIHQLAIDGRVLLVATAVSIGTGLLFGIVPALQAASGRGSTLLRSGRITGAHGGANATRRILLVAELSLALVLLVSAGLMVRTLDNLFGIDTGFQPEHVISGQLSLPAAQYPVERRLTFFDQVQQRLRAQPGVVAAAFTFSLPIQGSNWNSVFIVEGQPVPARADLPAAAWTPVTEPYFEAMGIRLLRGRTFTAADGQGAPTVAVVNESFVRRFWPNGDALGKRIKQGWPEDKTPWREIVGIVNDVKTGGVDQPVTIQAYLPLAQEPMRTLAVIARAAGDPARLRASIETAIREVDPNLPVYDVRTMRQVIEIGVGQQRLLAVLLLAFGGLSLILAAVGVFGVTAYTVSQRTHELGVRMALGADRRSVLRLVLGQGLTTCLIGLAIGLAAALAAGRLLQSLLFEVTPHDPATLAAVGVLLAGVTTAACYIPARRATRVDPVTALRCE